MACILLFNVPGHGHVNPTLPVVAELIRGGHRVIYYNLDAFRPKIERTGAEFRAYPETNLTDADFSKLVSNLVKVTLFLLEESLRLLPFVLDEIDREKPDLVIFDSIALWGMQGARLRRVPSVGSISTFVLRGMAGMVTWRDGVHMLRRSFRTVPALLRRRRSLMKIGGFPRRAVFPCLGDVNIVYTSRAMQPATPVLDDSFHFVGPSMRADFREPIDFPWDLLDEGRPRVYLSLGTLLGGDASFYRTAFEAFAGHSAQFILSAGHHLDLRSLDPVPENFIVRPAVPQLELLPKVDLFVTHGGANSLNEALYHGVPVVVIPPHLEQAVNGLHQRVTRATMPACTRSIRRRGRVIFEREDVEQREAAG